jgi:hypothetical protein
VTICSAGGNFKISCKPIIISSKSMVDLKLLTVEMIAKFSFVLNVWLNRSTVLSIFFVFFKKSNFKVKLESSSFEVSFFEYQN